MFFENLNSDAEIINALKVQNPHHKTLHYSNPQLHPRRREFLKIYIIIRILNNKFKVVIQQNIKIYTY